MHITALSVGAVLPAGLPIARRALSQQDLDALVVEIQGASTGPQLDAIGRRVRGFSATSYTDPSNGARLDQLRMAMRVRRDQLK